MTTPRRNQNALRAALRQEDAALSGRLPAAVEAAQAQELSANKPPAAKPAALRKPAARSAAGGARVKRAAVEAAPQPVAAPATAPAPVAAAVIRPDPERPATDPGRAEVARSKTQDGGLDEVARPGKAGKPVSLRVSLLKRERAQLKALRAALAAGGHKPGRNALLRAGLHAVLKLDEAAVLRALAALPALRSGKQGKPGKRRKSGKG